MGILVMGISILISRYDIYIYMRILYGRLSLLSIELTVVMDENKTHDRKFSGSPKEWE
jgi:hypothetical protein